MVTYFKNLKRINLKKQKKIINNKNNKYTDT